MKKVCNESVNDLPYGSVTYISKNGKKLNKRFYSVWRGMIYRCYSSEYKRLYPTYEGVTICSEWLTLSNFYAWFTDNYVDGYALDKDLINPEAKQYSPENCRFVPAKLNLLVVDNAKNRGKYGQGVSKSGAKYLASISINGKMKHIGTFNTDIEALSAYRYRKSRRIVEFILSLKESDPNYAIYSDAAESLMERALNGGVR